MADKTGISWTDATWNPLRGCSKVSAGCKNCYAEKVAARFSGPGQPYEGTTRDGRWNGNIRIVDEKLIEPLRWKRPRRIFVNSMSDLFHDGVPFEYVAAVFGVMAACPQHTFQVLTKRPARAVEFLRWIHSDGALTDGTASGDCGDYAFRAGCHFDVAVKSLNRPWPLPNVHLGVSAENQETADARIPLLLQCPAAVRFVSYEPALGPADFGVYLREHACDEWPKERAKGVNTCVGHPMPALDWIIVGGESGPNARPFDVAWARSAIAQCRAAGVVCFVKQLGAMPVVQFGEDPAMWPVPLRIADHPEMGAPFAVGMRPMLKDRAGADPAEWPENLRVQEFPEPGP